MVEIKQRLDNDDHYDNQNIQEYIVIHDTGNATDSDEGNANYFCTGTRNASAHYFVDSDSITQVVLDKDGSFHCGDGHDKNGIGNRNSLGIELCRTDNVITPETLNNALDLIRLLMNKYNIPLEKVVRHFDASGKICPRSMSADNWAKWHEFKARIIAPVNIILTSSPAPTTHMYRIRTSWDNVKSQKGAYSVLKNAEDYLKTIPTYKIFNENGNIVGEIPIVIKPVIVPKPVIKVAPVIKPTPIITYPDGSVKQLQHYLNTLKITNNVGHSLVEDNDAGKNTLEALGKSNATVRRGDKSILVRWIQVKLKCIVDDSYGDGKYHDLYDHVIAFQRAKGLSRDGVIGINTWRQLVK